MNIFYLDHDISNSVKYLVDKHVVKMPLETAQLLCNAVTLNGKVAPYKLTHTKHPCTIWTAKSAQNFAWLQKYGLELCKEYTFRYGKIHKCQSVIEGLQNVCDDISLQELPPQCMPDEYKAPCTVEAYRNYYRHAKAHIHSWRNRQVPEWI